MSISYQQAKAAYEEHGTYTGAARVFGVSRSTITNIIKAGQGKAVDADKESEPVCTGGLSKCGITLSATTRFSNRRPPVTLRSKFYTLPKGKAFTIGTLSKEWGFRPETIRRHARDEGCFAYIDTTGYDDFEECAMHPETAAVRLKGV